MHAVARTNGSFSQGRGSELVDVNIGGLLDRVADHRYLANESPVGTWHEVLINNGCGFASEAQYALMGYCTVPGRRPSSEFSVSLRLAGQAQMNVVNFFNNELSQAAGSELVDLNNDGLVGRVANYAYYIDGTLQGSATEVKMNTGAGWVAEGPDFRYPTSFAQSMDADVGQGEMGLPFVHVLALKSGGGLSVPCSWFPLRRCQQRSPPR